MDNKSLEKAIQYLISRVVKTDTGFAITVSDKNQSLYPEVTGYLIPTMLSLGYREYAVGMANWLVSIQNEDGSWSMCNQKHIFDTGMVIQGLNFFDGEYQSNIDKGVGFILANQDKPEYKDPNVPLEIINLALLFANHYDRKFEVKSFNCGNMLHFFAYVLEAVVGDQYTTYEEKVERIREIIKLQKDNGSIPAIFNQNWICYPSVAQMACLFYRLGFIKEGNKAISYLESVQNEDGSFYGSNYEYFKDEKILWATKYFIDAYLLKIEKDFDATVNEFSDSIEKNDYRVQQLLKTDFDNKIVLDAGCGKGRIAKIIAPKSKSVSGMDISNLFLNEYKKNVGDFCFQGSVLNIPIGDNCYDIVYSVEVLEHSVVPENAIKEMLRVLKPGGSLLIIDKNNSIKGGRKEWEYWFNDNQVSKTIEKCGGRNVESEIFGFGNMFIIWRATK